MKVSYIAFDLDALNVCPQVGAACGLTAAEAAHGLLQLWAWCFRSEKADVTNTHLRGFFGGADAGAALEAFGFTERTPNGWRVRGAARYLRIKQAQRDGGRKGRAASSSTVGKPKRTSKSTLKYTLGSTSGSTSTSTSGSQQALTPSTEHRTPTTEHPSVAPEGAHQALTDALCATHERVRGSPYPFSSKTDPHVGARNGKAVKALLGMGVAPTVLAAWERALRSDKFPLVRTLPELVTNFAHFVGNTGPPARDAPVEYAEGRVRL